MTFTDKELDRNVSQLTVRELIALIGMVNENPPQRTKVSEGEWINGLRDLAEFLSCSLSTVWRRLKNKELEGTYMKMGNRYWFDPKKVLKKVSEV